MKLKKNIRLPLGYAMGVLYLFRAQPTAASILAGALVMTVGECLRMISAGTLLKYKGVVSQNGIYAHTRNPLYLGSFLLGIGACVAGRDYLFTLLFLLLFVPVYHTVIKREEAFLLKKYGDAYEEYRRRVPRIIPGSLDMSSILRESSVARSLNNREWKTVLGAAAVVALLTAKAAWM